MKNSGCHGNKKNNKNFFSQTVRARAFIYGMWHHLVALYHDTSNDGAGVKICPTLRGLGFHKEVKKEILKIFLTRTIRARAFIFGI